MHLLVQRAGIWRAAGRYVKPGEGGWEGGWGGKEVIQRVAGVRGGGAGVRSAVAALAHQIHVYAAVTGGLWRA